MQIREVQAEDFEATNNLMLVLNEADTNINIEQRKSIFLSIVDDPTNHIFVGVHNNEIVSTCYLNIIPNITWGPAPYGLIENVVTLAAHRRNGYGRQCIRHAIDHAFENHCFKVMLSSSQRNERTRAFYDSVGLTQSKDGYAIYKNIV